MVNRGMLWRVSAVAVIGATAMRSGPRRPQPARGTANERPNAVQRPRVDSPAVATALGKRLAGAPPPLLRSDEWATMTECIVARNGPPCRYHSGGTNNKSNVAAVS